MLAFPTEMVHRFDFGWLVDKRVNSCTAEVSRHAMFLRATDARTRHYKVVVLTYRTVIDNPPHDTRGQESSTHELYGLKKGSSNFEAWLNSTRITPQ